MSLSQIVNASQAILSFRRIEILSLPGEIYFFLYLIEKLPPCPPPDDHHGMSCLIVISTFCTEDRKWENF